MSEMSLEVLEERKREANRVAEEIYRQGPDWVTFLREVMGVDGVLRKLFPSNEAMLAFEKTVEYQEIRQMLGRLRVRPVADSREKEPLRMITVRLPKCLHEILQAEANDKQVSMNRLCITKLLQLLDDDELAANGDR
jgi:hypothetical protein